MKLKEYLAGKIPENKVQFIPVSFDVIGDICIIEIKDEIKKYEKLIGTSILKLNKGIKSIFKKASARKGKYRTLKLKLIAGENKKETVYRESNVLFKLDIEKCYFSQRLSNERLRIAKLVRKNEKVLVMFSGIGSFGLVILKRASPKIVYLIEINKAAHKYALQNAILNKINPEKIKILQGNVKKVLPNIKIKFDRILMPLPKDSSSFIDLAFKKISKKGTIHYYSFLEEPKTGNPEKYWKTQIYKELEEYKNKFKINKIVKCGVYGPRIYRVCIDLKVI